MKKLYASGLVLLAISFFNFSNAQNLEDFEDETPGDTVFTSNGQDFYISNEQIERYNVFSHQFEDFGTTDDCVGCGWNGTAADNKFIDNSGHTNGNQNGSSFIVKSVGGVGFGVSSLYLFCSTMLAAPTTGTLTITGKLQEIGRASCRERVYAPV